MNKKNNRMAAAVKDKEPYVPGDRLKLLEGAQAKERAVIGQIEAEIERLQGELVKANNNQMARAGRCDEIIKMMAAETTGG